MTDYIPTGFRALDEILGGWRKKSITLLIGESGVGKSTLLIASAYHSLVKGLNVKYIDTEGNPVEEFLGRMNIEHIDSMDSLLDCVCRLERIPVEILYDGLIIVDSITFHYHAVIRSLENDSERDRLQAMLENIIYKLHRISVKNNLAVVMSTWPTSIGDPEEDFVGGFAVKTYSRTQVRILPESSDVRLLEIIKHQWPRRYKNVCRISLNEVLHVLEAEVVENVKQGV